MFLHVMLQHSSRGKIPLNNSPKIQPYIFVHRDYCLEGTQCLFICSAPNFRPPTPHRWVIHGMGWWVVIFDFQYKMSFSIRTTHLLCPSVYLPFSIISGVELELCLLSENVKN